METIELKFCQKVLLKSERKIEDFGKTVFDFTCQKTGLHFRLNPAEIHTREDRAAALRDICDRSCPYYKHPGKNQK